MNQIGIHFLFLEGSIVDSKHLIKIIESVIWKSSGRFEREKGGHSSHLDHLLDFYVYK